MFVSMKIEEEVEEEDVQHLQTLAESTESERALVEICKADGNLTITYKVLNLEMSQRCETASVLIRTVTC